MRESLVMFLDQGILYNILVCCSIKTGSFSHTRSWWSVPLGLSLTFVSKHCNNLLMGSDRPCTYRIMIVAHGFYLGSSEVGGIGWDLCMLLSVG